MSTDTERLQMAQWVFERNLAWIAAAEVKVGVIVAIDTAMLGGLGAAFSAADAKTQTHWAILMTLGAAILLGGGLAIAAMALLPQTRGPKKSLLFFGPIGETTEPDYVDALRAASVQQLLEDLSVQIHRNAQIAREKFKFVRQAMIWSFLAILPWFSAIVLLLHKKV